MRQPPQSNRCPKSCQLFSVGLDLRRRPNQRGICAPTRGGAVGSALGGLRSRHRANSHAVVEYRVAAIAKMPGFHSLILCKGLTNRPQPSTLGGHRPTPYRGDHHQSAPRAVPPSPLTRATLPDQTYQGGRHHPPTCCEWSRVAGTAQRGSHFRHPQLGACQPAPLPGNGVTHD